MYKSPKGKTLGIKHNTSYCFKIFFIMLRKLLFILNLEFHLGIAEKFPLPFLPASFLHVIDQGLANLFFL